MDLLILVQVDVDVVRGEAAVAGVRGSRGGALRYGDGAGVVVEVPLDVHLLRGAHAQARQDGRDVARAGEEGDARIVERGIQHGARAGGDGAAEGRIEEVLLRDAPADPLAVAADFRGCVVSAGGLAGVGSLVGLARGGQHLGRVDGGSGGAAGGVVVTPQEEPLGDAVLQLVGVAGDVDLVEAEHVGEVADAVGEAVGNLGLDGVLDVVAQEFADQAGVEGSLQHGRSHIELELKVGTVQRGVGLHRRGGITRDGRGSQCGEPAARVEGLASADGWPQPPAGKGDGIGNLRAQIEARNQAAGGEVGLRAFEFRERAVEVPLQPGRAQHVVGGGELHRRRVEDVYLLFRQDGDDASGRDALAGYALLTLVAVAFERSGHAVPLVRAVDGGDDIRRDGLIEVGGERLAILEGAEVLDVAGEAGRRGRGQRRGRLVAGEQIVPPGEGNVGAALVDVGAATGGVAAVLQ